MSDLSRLIERPRVPLAHLPTPITPVSWDWGPVRLYLKRDDLTGSGLSGNKVRKLEYLIADARARGCDTLVTCGGIQSNHTRAAAVAATLCGMRSVVVLSGDEPLELDGNLLLSRLVGADVRIVPAMSSSDRHARMLELAAELEQQGLRPYVMPSGGSSEVGALGYCRAVSELAEQLEADPRGVGCIVHACGSGGTFAGCHIGRELAGLAPRHVAVIIEGTVREWRASLVDYVNRTANYWDIDLEADPDAIALLDGAGRGYAVNTDEEMDFLVRFARVTGIFLDPVYTGKALYALDREVRRGTFDPGGHVLFIHTGGMYGLFPLRRRLMDAMKRSGG
jgi:D-cysteine desulfhydrase